MPRASKLILPALFLASSGAARASGGVPAEAEELFHVGPLPVTNSMVTSWVVALVLIVAVRLIVRRPRLVPTKGQAVVEGIIEWVLDLVRPIVGNRAVMAAFPLLIALFVFILTQNWSGLLPGVGTIGWGHADEAGRFHVSVPLIRPGNADMNGTIALALCAMLFWAYLIMRFAGPKAVFLDLFGNKASRGEVPSFIYFALFPVFAAVGIIEIISIVFRPVSLSFRLFGNVFGGENLIHAMSGIYPWGLPIPFYFLELLIGVVQALVFTLLVSVYIGLICNHGDDHAHEPGAPH